MPQTLEMILTEARTMIEERGENGLRVAELAERCNVAVGLLYHYFADRQAIIAEVRARQYIELARADIDRVTATVAGHGTESDLLNAALRSFGATLDDALRRRTRWSRLAILAASEHNEVLRDRIRAEQERTTAEFVAVLEQAQRDGIVRTDISARAIALLVEAVPLGTVLADVNPALAPTQQEWARLIEVLLASMGASQAEPVVD
ncbi:MAG: Bacterial regulatory protein tetR family [Actinomycetota bacterium]|jgi:AcrR family transcriptional regulator